MQVASVEPQLYIYMQWQRRRRRLRCIEPYIFNGESGALESRRVYAQAVLCPPSSHRLARVYPQKFRGSTAWSIEYSVLPPPSLFPDVQLGS